MGGVPISLLLLLGWAKSSYTSPWCRREGTVQETRGRDSQAVRWERGHFPCKEIKVKGEIKVRFPASWFVFGAEIPLFLSDFAETTIAPLPVLVTATPLTPSLGSGVQLHGAWSGGGGGGEFRAEARSTRWGGGGG